jgi:hypothetical protein
MFLLIVTVFIDYLIMSVLVGISFFSLFGHRIKSPFSRKVLIAMLVIFAVLDIYYLPALFSLQITMTVGNQEVANFFELKENMDVGDFFEPGWFDFIVWMLQSLLAYVVGTKVYQWSIAKA